VRAGALSDASVGEYVNKHFVSAWKRVGTFTAIRKDGKTVGRAGGNVAIYFCTPDLKVVNAIAGPVAKEGLLAAAKWAVETYRAALEQAKDDPEALVAALRKAHEEEFKRSPRHCFQSASRGEAAPVAAPCQDSSPPPPKENKETADRPSPPGKTVYHCVPAEDLERARLAETAQNAGTKTDVLPAIHRVETRLESGRRLIALAGGRLNLHRYLAQQGLPKLDEVYRHVFEGVLGQEVTDRPVHLRELPNGRVYTCQSLNALRTEPAPAVDIQDINARLKAALEQIEQLKKQVEDLKKAQ
jgi:hypothetical protein